MRILLKPVAFMHLVHLATVNQIPKALPIFTKRFGQCFALVNLPKMTATFFIYTAAEKAHRSMLSPMSSPTQPPKAIRKSSRAHIPNSHLKQMFFKQVS